MAQTGEPEKLVLPEGAIQELVALALRTDLGAALWRGFALAHGEPSWLAPGPDGRPRWRLVVNSGSLLPAERPAEAEEA